MNGKFKDSHMKQFDNAAIFHSKINDYKFPNDNKLSLFTVKPFMSKNSSLHDYH